MRWPQSDRESLALRLGFTPEVSALADGRVDAIFSNQGRAEALARTGRFTIVEDLRRYPDWTLTAPSGPYLTTVSGALARERPEVVVAFLRAAIRAGRWIDANQGEAARLLHRVTYQPTVAEVERDIAGIDFVPSLDARSLQGLRLTTDFLFAQGYITADVDLLRWTDDSFLARAFDAL